MSFLRKMKWSGGNWTQGHKCFWSLANVKPNVAPQFAIVTNILGDLCEEKFTLMFLLSFSSSLSSWWFFFYIYLFFNRALFLQCSHVTSMQSPYVLNSNVVDYRRILHKPLSYKQRLCKNDTPVNTLTNRSSDGNLLWCTFLAFSL